MNYWPLSTIATSPLMSLAYGFELSHVYKTCYLTPAAFIACGDVARRIQPQAAPNLVIVESVNAAARQMYIGYPSSKEWAALERGGVVEASNGMLHVIIDALH